MAAHPFPSALARSLLVLRKPAASTATDTGQHASILLEILTTLAIEDGNALGEIRGLEKTALPRTVLRTVLKTVPSIGFVAAGYRIASDLLCSDSGPDGGVAQATGMNHDIADDAFYPRCPR